MIMNVLSEQENVPPNDEYQYFKFPTNNCVTGILDNSAKILWQETDVQTKICIALYTKILFFPANFCLENIAFILLNILIMKYRIVVM